MDERLAPYLSVVWTDPVTGRNGYVVIDRLVRGIAGGGTRVRRGVTLQEVARLARTMTLKNGSLDVPAGGAKGGLDCELAEPGGKELLVRFLRAVKPLLETCWGTAEDLGVTQEELDAACRQVGLQLSVQAGLKVGGDPDAALDRVRRGMAVAAGGITLPDLIGGYGVAEAAAAALDHLGLPAARVVAEAANIPTTEATDRRLHQRGVVVVPDFVANAAANGWWWMVMLGEIEPTEEAAYAYAARTIRDTVDRLLRRSAAAGVTPREAAAGIAMENVERNARSYGAEVPRTPAGADR